jgi:hypothetical protein
MLSIDDYLALKDWTFTLDITEGVHGDYFWLRSEHLSVINFLDAIPLPTKAFRVLVTYWDGSGGAAQFYSKEPGWQALGEFAISAPMTEIPQLNFEADSAQMLLDSQLTISQVSHILNTHKKAGFSAREDSPEANDFWNVIEALEPYCYASDLGDLFFIARGEALYRTFVTSADVTGIEDWYRQRTAAERKRLWAELGPNCGPETCIEPGCTELRIRLAVKCFVHQML